MRVRFVCIMIIFFGASILITGCGEEDITEPEEEIAEPEETVMEKGPPGTAFTITPAPGAVISSNQEFTLTFDIAVIEVIVNGISATDTKAGGFGGVWIVSLILEPGPRSLSVEWTESNGCIGDQASGPYTVVADED